MEGTLAEIRMFAGNFAPRGWMFCQGQLLPISQWTAVFALVGTTYGGDGQVTFGLPDFRGRVGDGTGNGAGLQSVILGEAAGLPSTALTTANLPAHNHNATLSVSSVKATLQLAAAGAVLGKGVDGGGVGAVPRIYAPAGSATDVALGGSSPTSVAGGNQPFSTMQPYLGMNFIICVEGIFPSRN